MTSKTLVGEYYVTNIRLGRGSSATVYLGYHKDKKYEVAVKKFELSSDSSRIQKRAEREIQILKAVDHPNIVGLHAIVRDRVHNDIYMFLEYCPNGSLRTFLGKGGYLEEQQAQQILSQLRSSLKHLHDRKIYHRDIKPHNILLSKKFKLKISDFGFATLSTRGSFKRVCGSPLYMAPEILRAGFYDQRSDLWSIGVVMYEILFGHHPFPHIKHFVELSRLMTEPLYIKIPPDIRPVSSKPTWPCIHLLRRLLTPDPRLRLTWEEFFDHTWLNSVDTHSDDIPEVSILEEELGDSTDTESEERLQESGNVLITPSPPKLNNKRNITRCFSEELTSHQNIRSTSKKNNTLTSQTTKDIEEMRKKISHLHKIEIPVFGTSPDGSDNRKK